MLEIIPSAGDKLRVEGVVLVERTASGVAGSERVGAGPHVEGKVVVVMELDEGRRRAAAVPWDLSFACVEVLVVAAPVSFLGFVASFA